MNILLIAPVHDYATFSRQRDELHIVEGQGQQSWHRALISLGHNVKVFRYTDSLVIPEVLQQHITHFSSTHFPIFYSRFRKFHDMLAPIDLVWKIKNDRICSTISTFRPDIVIVSGGTAFLSSRVFSAIKKTQRIPIIYFSGVHPLNAASSRERSWVVHCADYVVTNDTGYAHSWKSLGAKNVITLPISAFDDLSEKKTLSHDTQKKYRSDVCFVGTLTKDRIKLLEHLKTYHLKIWGTLSSDAKLSNELKQHYYGIARHDELNPIYRSTKIALNIQPKDMVSSGNMRTFEISGYGAFQLTDKMNKAWFNDGKEVVTFKDKKDLINKIDYFLKNDAERERIADAGQARTLKDHTYRKRFRRLFSMIKVKSL